MQNITYDEARRRVKKLKEFYIHLSVYLAVNLGLLIINIATDPHQLWFHWVTVFWGIGVILHAAQAFSDHFFNPVWEENKVRKLMGQDDDRTQAK